jgi:hypothetical protein
LCRGEQTALKVQEWLRAAGRTVSLQNTTHSGHAKELAACLDVEGTACIVAVGGDGTFHEILQVCSHSCSNFDEPRSGSVFQMIGCLIQASVGSNFETQCRSARLLLV